jgi:hypothetical protein
VRHYQRLNAIEGLYTIVSFITSGGGEPGVSGNAFKESSSLKYGIPGFVVLSHWNPHVYGTISGGIFESLSHNFLPWM